ncbi:MAG TPA: FAD-dependent oxidoreductase [Pirellulaceae bacterium]|nr:FAD-dependent oxidoreductase [Pirellulaceae bacterium]HMO94143.1 FAD-dependent oxidoreductase [Pirellulaceae bacterium]HMP71214.1 FAD-dependent oxidoreductase [Pirellulaceae bacterium]
MNFDLETHDSISIVGGGIIGLCVGYELSKAGYKVVIIDRDPNWSQSSAQKNAGMIVPSHFIPLAAPGVVKLGLKWMFSRKSPFALSPQLNLEMWRWCWTLYRHANREHVERCGPLLRDIGLLSRRLFDEIAEQLCIPLERHGLLMLCQTEAALHKESQTAEQANSLGIEAEVCIADRLRELDPNATINAIGGVWFPQDAHLDSKTLLTKLRDAVEKNGGQIVQGEVQRLHVRGNRLAALELKDGQTYSARSFVLSGGAWSQDLARQLNLRLPLQAGKGYSFTMENVPELPALCSILVEARVAVTPIGNCLRVAGTMEIGGNDLRVNQRRTEGIIESFCRYYSAFKPENFVGIEPWAGLRPCSPDGLPYIGKLLHLQNVIVATGHAMLGLSLGPVTGLLVKQILADEEPAIDVKPLAPYRFDKRYKV